MYRFSSIPPKILSTCPEWSQKSSVQMGDGMIPTSQVEPAPKAKGKAKAKAKAKAAAKVPAT